MSKKEELPFQFYLTDVSAKKKHLRRSLCSEDYIRLLYFLTYYGERDKEPWVTILKIAEQYNESRTITRFSELSRIAAVIPEEALPPRYESVVKELRGKRNAEEDRGRL